MATSLRKKDRQILEEMRLLFPQLPEHIIQSCISQCQNDKNVCYKLLETYVLPNQNLGHGSGVLDKMHHTGLPTHLPASQKTVKMPANSQSFGGTGVIGIQDALEKPQSTPVTNDMLFPESDDFPPPYSSYYSRPYRQYLPREKYVSTLEIPPRPYSRLNMELQQQIPVNPQLSISVYTNGPSGSRVMERPSNPGFHLAPPSPRTSPRSRVLPSAGNDKEAFLQALLSHQDAQHQQLYRELAVSKDMLQKLQRQVSSLEESLQSSVTYSTNSNSTSGEALRSMRDEITKLRVECHCLSVEADLCIRNQSQQGEDFYQNIFPGQAGPIPPVSPNDDNGNRVEDNEESKWKCSACTYNNHPALNTCEMCEMPRKIIDSLMV